MEKLTGEERKVINIAVMWYNKGGYKWEREIERVWWQEMICDVRITWKVKDFMLALGFENCDMGGRNSLWFILQMVNNAGKSLLTVTEQKSDGNRPKYRTCILELISRGASAPVVDGATYPWCNKIWWILLSFSRYVQTTFYLSYLQMKNRKCR